MRKVILAAVAWLLLCVPLSAQYFNFPPGTFQSRAPLDTAGGLFTKMDSGFTNGNQTFSNLDLTITGTGSGNAISRTVANHLTGKYYWEITVGPIGNLAIGFGTSAAAVGDYVTSNGNQTIGYGYGGSSWAGVGLSGTCTVNALVNGNTIGIALDMTVGLVWAKDVTAGGNWNNNAGSNPATGAGGCDYSAGGVFTSGLQIYAMVTAAASGDVATFNFGASYAIGMPPTGFGNL